jgi:DNA-binding MarR family transcriptional regulator
MRGSQVAAGRASSEDVERLVAALFAVTSGLARARRKIPDAAALAVLQIVAWAEREIPPVPVRPSQIATALDVHRSAVTHQLQALARAGHITLSVDPADRRSSFVALTESGRAESARLTAVGMARFASFVDDWDAADVQTLTRLLVKFEESKARAGAERRAPPAAVGDEPAPQPAPESPGTAKGVDR